jgi:hypothetical protein
MKQNKNKDISIAFTKPQLINLEPCINNVYVNAKHLLIFDFCHSKSAKLNIQNLQAQ